MKRGRKPKPTALRIFEGNPGKRPLPKGSPTPARPAAVPDPPAHLDAKAIEFWTKYAPQLFELDLLSALDVEALGLAAAAWSEYVHAAEVLKQHGLLVKSEGGNFYQHPYVAIRNKAEERLRYWFAEYGFTPSSRTRLKTGADKSPVDDLEKLLGAG